jgi:Toprim domain
MSKRPLDNISYQQIVAARAGSRASTADIPCPVCGPQHEGASARRKVLRTWTLGGDRISLHCARCGLEGWVGPEGGGVRGRNTTSTSISSVDAAADERERQRRIARLATATWEEAVSIEGSAGSAYFAKRGIDLALVPDYGGLRWHPQCPWEGGPIGCVVSRFTDAVTGGPRGIHRRPMDGQKPRTLGPMRGCVIRLWPDEDVTTGLVLGEGIESTLSAALHIMHRGTRLRPAWASGSAGNMREFSVLAGIEALTILVDHDASGTGQEAAAACARRWCDAGREVIRLTPKMVGQDFNDIIRKGAA